MSPPGALAASAAAAGCSVRVAVRVRPLLSFEKTERLGECVSCVANSTQLLVGDGQAGGGDGRNTFTFDFTFPKQCEQRMLYDDCVASLLEAFFEGFNATILAYGQTGSGKTYTMGSASSLRITEDEQGIIPRVITGMYDLLREAAEERPHVSYTVRCQFLEIYGEDIHDLLEPAASTVTIREGQNGEVNVHGAKEMMVHGAEEMAMLLERGSLCRTTGSTLMNAHSSRSHAIFTVLLEQRIRPEGEGPDPEGKVDTDDVEIRRSKFHFVDLAGSERAKRTGASGQRFKEGVEINKGLLTLGNVISALGDDTKRGKVHVPYRDSKLTRMLQDSLGGNSQTLMICCVSPAESNMHETLSALRYANRARNIQNKPVVNRDANSAVISELREKVQALAAELLRIRSGGGAATSDEGSEEQEGGGSGLVSEASLRELAVLSTPARQLQRPMGSRVSSSRVGSVEVPLGVQREITMLRARAAEAEGEVHRLTEEAKLARRRESEKDDRLAGVRAELDLAHAEIMAARVAGERGGRVGTDRLMLEIAQAAGGDSGGDKGRQESVGDGNLNGSGSSPRPVLGMFKGFFGGSGSLRSPKSPGSRTNDGTGFTGAIAQSSPKGSSNSRGAVAVGAGAVSADAAKGGKESTDDPRTRALAVMKDFHGRIQKLEERLRDSERQRAALERQLVHHSSGGAGGGGSGAGSGGSVGLSSMLAAAAGDGSAGVTAGLDGVDAVAEAERRIAEEKKRKKKLLASLDSGGEDGGHSSGKTAGGASRQVKGSGSGGGSSSSRDGEADGEEEEEEEDEEDEEEEEDGSPNVVRRLCVSSSVITAAEEEERALRKSETRINAELSDLDKSIIVKEALLLQIKEGQASFATMQKHYERKLQEMDEEVRRHENEHERLLADLEELEKKTEVAVQEEREKLRNQLKDKTAALQKAKDRQSELSVLSRDRRIKEDTVRGLEAEISKMKKNKVDLQRRLDCEQKRQRELLMEKSREIMSLKRKATKDQAEVKRLERAKGKAEAISKRHLDELALIRRLQRQKLGVGRKQKLTAQEKETKKRLDAKVKELTRREEAAERLAAEYEKKLLLLQQKESLELVKVSITSRRDQRQRRNRDAAARSRLSPPVANRSDQHRSEHGSTTPLSPRPLPRVAAAKQHALPPPPPHHHQQQLQSGASVQGMGAAPAAGAAATIPLLPLPPPQVATALDSEMTLRAALPDEMGLDEEELETLREVEERLESNKAQLEYKDRKIVSIQQEVEAWAERRRQRRRGGGGGASGGVLGQPPAGPGQGQGHGSGEHVRSAAGGGEVGEAQMIEELESDVNDLKGARGTIRVLFSSLVAARRGQKQKAMAAKELQESLGEKTIALEQTQERLHAEQRSYDRKLTSITSEYERNLNGLINHTAMSGLLQTAINRTEEGVGVATPLSNSIPTTGGSGYGSENAAAAAGTDGNSAAGAELVDGGGGGGGVDRARAAVSGEGVGDTTQHAMTKVLHERWLSEREKARTLEARLSDAEARMSDMDEVRKNERKAFTDKQQDVEWLSYELRTYRSRCSQLRDEKDKQTTLCQQLQTEADVLRRRITASSTSYAGSDVGRHGHGHGHPPAPTSPPSSRRPPSPSSTTTRYTSARLSSSPTTGGASGASPSRRYHQQAGESGGRSWMAGRDSPPAPRDRDRGRDRDRDRDRDGGRGGGAGSGDRGRAVSLGDGEGTSRGGGGGGGGGTAGMLGSPDNPSSEIGSEYDDEYVDEQEEPLGGEVDFAGVTSDIEAIRDGKMPESMQLVARLNAEAGGKLSVFDRLASTTTESRRQKVNDRDQLQENLRRKARQDAIRKKKDFKILPLPGSSNGQPPAVGLGSTGSSISSSLSSTMGSTMSVAEAVANLEKNSSTSNSEGHDGGRSNATTSLRDSRPGTGRGGVEETTAPTWAAGGGLSQHRGAVEPIKELSVFERLQAPSTRRSSGDHVTPTRSTFSKNIPSKKPRSPSSQNQKQAPPNHSKAGGVAHKKYMNNINKMGPGNATLAARLQAEAELSRVPNTHSSSGSGSPPRAIAAQSGADDSSASGNSLNSNSKDGNGSAEGLDVVEEVSEGTGIERRRERRPVGARGDRDGATHGRGGHVTGTSGGASGNNVFDRLRNKLTESEQRRQAEAMAASGRHPFNSRRASQDKEAVPNGGGSSHT